MALPPGYEPSAQQSCKATSDVVHTCDISSRGAVRCATQHQGWSPTMPRSKSHQPNSGFTTTSMKLRGEIRDVLLPKITHLDMLMQLVDDLATSRTFYLYVRPLDAVTVKVG